MGGRGMTNQLPRRTMGRVSCPDGGNLHDLTHPCGSHEAIQLIHIRRQANTVGADYSRT
jgi:hypothetical protein